MIKLFFIGMSGAGKSYWARNERYAHLFVPMERLREAALDARGFHELLFLQARPTR